PARPGRPSASAAGSTRQPLSSFIARPPDPAREDGAILPTRPPAVKDFRLPPGTSPGGAEPRRRRGRIATKNAKSTKRKRSRSRRALSYSCSCSYSYSLLLFLWLFVFFVAIPLLRLCGSAWGLLPLWPALRACAGRAPFWAWAGGRRR